MSNYLAIATVTGTLHNVLSNAAAVVPGAKVSTKRPDAATAASQEPGIKIFLYQVTPNAAYRNADLPTRRANGEMVQRPQAALTLHYLLSFFGDDTHLEPQRLLGAVARQLHAQPLLTKQDITQTVMNPPYDTLLATSNLAEQVDLVRFTPLGLSLEEMSKIWSILFQAPYVLSVVYQGNAVLIETDDVPQRSLPVQTRNLYVLTFRHPSIDRVISTEGEFAPIVSTSTLEIDGEQLQGETTVVLLGGSERTPLSITDKKITLAVPAGLQAGARGLQVIQKRQGTPAGFESNVATFILRRKIAGLMKTTQPDPPSPALQVTVDSTIGKDQRVALLLNSTDANNPQAYSFLSRPRSADATSVTIAIPGVSPGQYFVRLQVDGAESPLSFDPPSPYFVPPVALP